MLMSQDSGRTTDLLAAMQLARRTADRHRDLAESLRQEAASWIGKHGGRDHLVKLAVDGGSLDHEEQNHVFGESLPRGLRIL